MGFRAFHYVLGSFAPILKRTGVTANEGIIGHIFRDNADHQDITFGMFESLYKANRSDCDTWVMGINTPKVSVMDTPRTHLVDCPKRPGIEKKTFDLKELHPLLAGEY